MTITISHLLQECTLCYNMFYIRDILSGRFYGTVEAIAEGISVIKGNIGLTPYID